MAFKKFKQSIWLEVVALVAISVFTYLIHISRLSYYRDDWYYMFDGLVGGHGVFTEMFRHLRPARGPLFDFLFSLFGINPLPYLFLLYLWRLIGGLGALWLFRLLWPQQRSATFFMSTLFLIYPGFLWWVQGFEYQPMVLSVGLQIFSIAFTLQSLQSKSRMAWTLWVLASLLTGWAYLAYVEYAIGMEVLRWLCIYLLSSRSNQPRLQQVISSFRSAMVPLLIPLGFLFWHQFIFENQRKAADLGAQASTLLGSPTSVLWGLVRLFESVLNVSLFAWVTPFVQSFGLVRLTDLLLSFGWAGLVMAISYTTYNWGRSDFEEASSSSSWQVEAIAVGLVSVIAGVIPIVVANRVVTLERFSHYALPASVAAVMTLVGFLYLLTDHRIRTLTLTALIGLSVLSHATLAARAHDEEQTIRDFWHQVFWRAPNIKADTLLLVNYAGMEYGEGNDIVWGPANFIYAALPQTQIPLVVPIAAARLEADTPKNILEGAELSQNYIVINSINSDFGNLLVMTLPSSSACVHVMDGAQAEISVQDTALIALAAPKSHIENINMNAVPPVPFETVFGKEPKHEWCFYYQKAQAARQVEDWKTVLQIGQQAGQLELHPNDQIEWMPFLQAAAMLGDEKQVRQISTRINTERLYKQQACQNLKTMPLSPDMQALTSELFCGGK